MLIKIVLSNLIRLCIAAAIIVGYYKFKNREQEVFLEKMKQPQTRRNIAIGAVLIYSTWFTFNIMLRSAKTGANYFIPIYSNVLFLLLTISFIIMGYIIYQTLQWKKAGQINRKVMQVVAGTLAIGLVLNMVGYGQIGNAFTVVKKEANITDIHKVYNKDGTVKHRADGSEVLDTHYGEPKAVKAYGFNPVPLIFIVAGNGVLYYGWKSAKKSQQGATA